MPKNTNPSRIARTVRAPRDVILASRDSTLRNWRVVVDGSAANLELLSFNKQAGVGFAIGPVTGQLYLVIQTGDAKLSNWRVRVAIYAAHDDGTDTLSFATDRFGGVVNQGVVR
jgi:hypothetical protein